MSDHARPLRDRIPLVVAGIGLGILVMAGLAFQGSDGFAYDFRAYDAAARRLTEGQPVYLPGTAEAYAAGDFEGLYLYPPPVALGMTPLALLPTDAAAAAWFVLRMALLAVGCALLPVSRAARLATFGVACASFPVLYDLNLGNVSIVIFTLTAVSWRFADSAGAATAHAALVLLRIPFGAFAILWLSQGRWHPLVRAAIALLILVLVSLPFVGPDAYREYVAILLGLPDVTAGEHNFSLRSVAEAAGLGATLGTVALAAGVALGAVAIAFAGLRRDRDTAFVVTAVATLLTAPFLHPHYLVILLVPAAFLFDRLSPAAVALPLAGWLPGDVMPLVPLAVLGLLLVPAVSGLRAESTGLSMPRSAARPS